MPLVAGGAGRAPHAVGPTAHPGCSRASVPSRSGTLLQVLTRPFCVNEIRMALQYRKNVILAFQTSKDFGGVPGGFAEFYGPELKKAFPHPADYSWLTRNSYVQFYDRGRHVKVGRLCAAAYA